MLRLYITQAHFFHLGAFNFINLFSLHFPIEASTRQQERCETLNRVSHTDHNSLIDQQQKHESLAGLNSYLSCVIGRLHNSTVSRRETPNWIEMNHGHRGGFFGNQDECHGGHVRSNLS